MHLHPTPSMQSKSHTGFKSKNNEPGIQKIKPGSKITSQTYKWEARLGELRTVRLIDSFAQEKPLTFHWDRK